MQGLIPAAKYALSPCGFSAGEARRPFLPLGGQARIRAAIEENPENGWTPF